MLFKPLLQSTAHSVSGWHSLASEGFTSTYVKKRGSVLNKNVAPCSHTFRLIHLDHVVKKLLPYSPCSAFPSSWQWTRGRSSSTSWGRSSHGLRQKPSQSCSTQAHRPWQKNVMSYLQLMSVLVHWHHTTRSIGVHKQWNNHCIDYLALDIAPPSRMIRFWPNLLRPNSKG